MCTDEAMRSGYLDPSTYPELTDHGGQLVNLSHKLLKNSMAVIQRPSPSFWCLTFATSSSIYRNYSVKPL